MRYYKLTISEPPKETKPHGTGISLSTISKGLSVVQSESPYGFIDLTKTVDQFEGGTKNPTALNIEFEVMSFSDGMAGMPGSIVLYNPTPDYFVNAQSYIGKQIKLQAGFENSPLAQKAGYTYVEDDIIFVGIIDNVIGNFSTRTPNIFFSFAIDSKAQKAALDRQKKKKAEKSPNAGEKDQRGEYSVTIKPNQKIMPGLVKGIKFFTDWLVKPDTLLNMLTNPGTQSIVITAKTLEALLAIYKEKFNVGASISMKQNLIDLYIGNGAVIEENALELAPNDFVAQPEILNLSGNISCVCRLRADLQIGTKVTIIGVIPSTAQLIAGVAGGYVTSSVDGTNLFALGTYTIYQVVHRGEWANMAVDGWVTTFQASPVVDGIGRYERKK